ncbi:MAG: UbiA family prenyltransferase, partial [Candidatus Angelobacter sp.]
TAAVTFWVGGFDVLYACQDLDFDRSHALNSVPQAFGIHRALLLARTLHILMLGLLLALVVLFGLGKIAILGVLTVALLLVYEHSLVSAGDLSKLNAAFFTMNGVISLVFFIFIAADILTRTHA